MTRKLPERLRPLGRLDLLDDVFQNVAGHYARADARTDPVSLAREADFLTNWSQILRPRGETHAAVDRLRDALQKARAATAKQGAPPSAIRARINTGRRLAEALIEAEKYNEAENLLAEASSFAVSHRAGDISFRSLAADLEMERYFLAWKQRKREQALPHAEEALRQRQAFQPELERPSHTPEKMAGLKIIIENWISLTEAHTRLANAAELRQHLDGLNNLIERLLVVLPDDVGMRFYSVNRWLMLATHAAGEPETAQAFYTKAENEAALLLARDGSNMEWRMAAVHAAARLETLYWKAGDEPNRLAARRRTAEWLEYLYSANLTDVHFLLHTRSWAVQCADSHSGDDWPAAKYHYTQSLNAQRRIAQLTGDKAAEESTRKATGHIFEKVAEHEGQEAAEKWRREFEAR
jgi:hypothetical protein